MLVLTRKPDQKILFNGGDIEVTINEVRGNLVKIGIEASNNVNIVREEAFVGKRIAPGTARNVVLRADIEKTLRILWKCLYKNDGSFEDFCDTQLDKYAEFLKEKVELII